MTLPDDFREFLRCLNAHDVRYLVVGGHAVSFHGYPRFTHDVDVVVLPEELNAHFKGVDLAEAWSRRVPGLVDGVGVAFIAREDLIANKRAVGRPEDLADIARLADG